MNQYDFLEQLGVGSHGEVNKVRHALTGQTYALKTVHRSSPHDAQIAQAECHALQACSHPNVVRLHKAFAEGSDVHIVLEYLGGGDLTKWLPLTERQISVVCRDVLRALEYLHGKGIVHRDVKASNVLLSDAFELKLIDFGVCGRLESGCHTVVGSPHWMAPEVIAASSDDGYGGTADVWSLGIMAIELATGSAPWKGLPVFQVFHNILKEASPTLPVSVNASTEFQDFVALCLCKDPSSRPRPSELLSTHPFLKTTSTPGMIFSHRSSPQQPLSSFPEPQCATALREAIASLQKKQTDLVIRGALTAFQSAVKEAEASCEGSGGFVKPFLMEMLQPSAAAPPQNKRTGEQPSSLLSPSHAASPITPSPAAAGGLRSVTSIPDMVEVGPYVDPVPAMYNRWRKMQVGK